ncbi:MAG: formyltransferase family protein [Adhaeribacter sp.]
MGKSSLLAIIALTRMVMKIGLLTSESIPDFRFQTLQPILADPAFSIVLAIVDTSPTPSFKQKVLKNLKKGRGGYLLVMGWNYFFAGKEKKIPTRPFCQAQGIAVIETSSPYSPQILDQIRSFDLDALVLVGGFGIVKLPLLNVPRIGVLSYHHGDMRKYRGMPPGLWELYHNEREMGVTVQLLSPGLDCGRPVVERSIPINQTDSLARLRARALQESTIMMHQALQKVADPNFVPGLIAEYGKVYTLPDLKQWLVLQARILRRKWAKPAKPI